VLLDLLGTSWAAALHRHGELVMVIIDRPIIEVATIDVANTAMANSSW
jgi:hypothetical protein